MLLADILSGLRAVESDIVDVEAVSPLSSKREEDS